MGAFCAPWDVFSCDWFTQKWLKARKQRKKIMQAFKLLEDVTKTLEHDFNNLKVLTDQLPTATLPEFGIVLQALGSLNIPSIQEMTSITKDVFTVVSFLKSMDDNQFNFPAMALLQCLVDAVLQELKQRAKHECAEFTKDLEQLVSKLSAAVPQQLVQAFDPIKLYIAQTFPSGFSLQSLFATMHETFVKFPISIMQDRLQSVKNKLKEVTSPEAVQQFITAGSEQTKAIIKQRIDDFKHELEALRFDIQELFSSVFMDNIVKPVLELASMLPKILVELSKAVMTLVMDAIKEMSAFMAKSVNRVQTAFSIPAYITCIVSEPEILGIILAKLQTMQSSFSPQNIENFLQSVQQVIADHGLSKEGVVEGINSATNAFTSMLQNIGTYITQLIAKIDQMMQEVTHFIENDLHKAIDMLVGGILGKVTGLANEQLGKANVLIDNVKQGVEDAKNKLTNLFKVKI